MLLYSFAVSAFEGGFCNMPANILITGASGGIGSEVARALAPEGRLFLIGNHGKEALIRLTEELLSQGFSASCFFADLSREEGCRAAFSEYDRLFGPPDLLVNCAGIAHVSLIQDTDEPKLQEILQTNLSSCIRMSREAARRMIPAKSGRIINISSVFGIIGASCEAEYSATKGAVNAFTKSLAKELAPSGIAVNAIAPGAIDTLMNSNLSPQEKKALAEEIPAGRFGTPEEVAECVRLLAKAPLYLTGQIIAVDGGWS